MADFWCILELPLAERIIRKYLIPRAMPMMNFEFCARLVETLAQARMLNYSQLTPAIVN